jgi:hypothetical protein
LVSTEQVVCVKFSKWDKTRIYLGTKPTPFAKFQFVGSGLVVHRPRVVGTKINSGHLWSRLVIFGNIRPELGRLPDGSVDPDPHKLYRPKTFFSKEKVKVSILYQALTKAGMLPGKVVVKSDAASSLGLLGGGKRPPSRFWQILNLCGLW